MWYLSNLFKKDKNNMDIIIFGLVMLILGIIVSCSIKFDQVDNTITGLENRIKELEKKLSNKNE
jgi:hypothetical protein